MAGAASWKGAIRVGPIIQFPVRARSVVRELTFSFNMHHNVDGGRLRQGDMVCEACGELLGRDHADVIKGYEGYLGEPREDGSFPGVDVDFLKSLEQERSQMIELDGLIPIDSLDPRFFQKSYDVVPDKGGERTYVLVLRLLERHQKMAIGTLTFSGKQFLVVLRPRAGTLAMEALYWPEEVGAIADADQFAHVDISEKELQMGDQLVNFLSTDLDLGRYTNEWAQATADYLEAYKAGTTPSPARPHEPMAVPTGSLEDQLARSLAAMTPAAPAKKARKGKVA